MSGVRVPPSARSRQGHAPTDPHMDENAARRTGPCSLKLIVPKRYSIFIYAVRNALVWITGVEPVHGIEAFICLALPYAIST